MTAPCCPVWLPKKASPARQQDKTFKECRGRPIHQLLQERQSQHPAQHRPGGSFSGGSRQKCSLNVLEIPCNS